MLLTGTECDSPIGDTSPASRLEVLPRPPSGSKYELVLEGAEHSAFSDRASGDMKKRNPDHHRASWLMTTAFWDAYLKEDAAAKAWLDGPGAKGDVLEKTAGRGSSSPAPIERLTTL